MLFGKFIGFILAKLLSPLSSFLIIIFVARTYGNETLGQYNTILVWLVLFQHLSIFGLCEFISREVGADPDKVGTYVFHSVIISFCYGAGSILIMLGGALFFNYPDSVRQGIVVASLALPFTSTILVYQAAFTALQKISFVAVGCVAENFMFLAAGIAAIRSGNNILFLIWALVLARIVSAGAHVCLFRKYIARLSIHIDWPFLKKIISPVVVFGLTGIAFQVFMRIDVILLSRIKEMKTVGIYSSASKLWEICLMLPLTFYFLNLPVLAEGYRKSIKGVTHTIQFYTQLFFYMVFGVFGVGFFFSETIITILYGKNFLEAALILRILMFAFLIHCTEIILEMSCQAAGYQKIALRIAVIRAVLNIVLNLFLIPLWGALGAALATAFSIACSLSFFKYIVNRTLEHIPMIPNIIKPALICLFVIFVLKSISNNMQSIKMVSLFLIIYLSLVSIMYFISGSKKNRLNLGF